MKNLIGGLIMLIGSFCAGSLYEQYKIDSRVVEDVRKKEEK